MLTFATCVQRLFIDSFHFVFVLQNVQMSITYELPILILFKVNRLPLRQRLESSVFENIRGKEYKLEIRAYNVDTQLKGYTAVTSNVALSGTIKQKHTHSFTNKEVSN